MNRIITISREFGSGGHEVAKRLADRLGVSFFDEELIARAAEKTGYNREYIRDNDEKAPDFSFSGVFSGFDSFQTSPFTKVQEEEFNIIREIAAEGSCHIQNIRQHSFISLRILSHIVIDQLLEYGLIY